ncbi:unnamed protein product [Lymnaea stagnalis]|uniref:Uncharacterized protein n=1 Tax=Lymnaea stagnalis TaxID=6523 RepID=A0AAV2GYT1_LYMST
MENPTHYCVNFVANLTQAKPLCTYMESAFDTLLKFILKQLDQHICGNAKSRYHYTKILYCSILVDHLKCMQDEGKEFDIDTLPRFHAVSETIRELCATNDSINRQCLLGHMSDVSQCIQMEVKSILKMKNTPWTYGALDKCSHLEIKVLCMWEELLSCEEKTSSIMTNLIVVLFSPQVCLRSGAVLVQSLCGATLNLVVLMMSYFFHSVF